MKFLLAHLSDLIVLTILGVVLFFAIRSIRKAKKSGSPCGCGCSGCSAKNCHSAHHH